MPILRSHANATIMATMLAGGAMAGADEDRAFPHRMPQAQPDMPLSAAMERMFSYPTPRVQDNPLFSQFKYTRLEGFDYRGGDGTLSRRDSHR